MTPTPAARLRRLGERHRGLALLASAMALLSLFFLVGVVVDDRTITGAPAWLKPAKFGVSITVYTLSLLWLLGFVRQDRPWRRRAVAAFGWTVTAVFVLEMIPIVLQVVRGTTSHFNVATPLDAALFGMMGTAIVVLWIVNLLLAGWLLVERIEPAALAWGIRLGLIVALVGMAEGFLMTSPTAQQLAGWQEGAPVTVVGAHTVGAPDGGPGLPVVGWSTTGGDLRVGHFVGMHALQVLPLLGWFVGRRRASRRRKVATVAVLAAGYLGLTLLLTWQALRAQPLLQPDALTLGALAGLATAVAFALAALWIRPGPVPRPLGTANAKEIP